MPALDAGIHVFPREKQDVDGRDKPGHDARIRQEKSPAPALAKRLRRRPGLAAEEAGEV